MSLDYPKPEAGMGDVIAGQGAGPQQNNGRRFSARIALMGADALQQLLDRLKRELEAAQAVAQEASEAAENDGHDDAKHDTAREAQVDVVLIQRRITAVNKRISQLTGPDAPGE